MKVAVDSNDAVTQQRWLARIMRNETVGGVLLLLCAVAALIWANSAAHEAYEHFIHFKLGPSSLGLHLPLHVWAADGLLAVFFFVAGVELKHEFVSGTLSTPRLASVPMAAAFGGMLTSGLIFIAINRGTPVAQAWGLPISTDIAFALAVLAVVGRGLPIELRTFLLTLAVVNDLGAITVIAIFYSHGFNAIAFVAACICIGVFALLQSRGVRVPGLYILLALVIWYATFRSGIHATVAGVAMGLAMRVKRHEGESVSPADRADDLLRPFSAGLCAPLFALVSTGIVFDGLAVGDAIRNPLTIGVVAGLVIGQPLGVMLGAFLTSRFTKGQLNPALSWWDVLVVGTLASIGFTVALLINEVSFGDDVAQLTSGKFAIVLTNVVAILVSSSAVLLRTRAISRSAN
jgi:NhaA family Na+:H+ antiporter